MAAARPRRLIRVARRQLGGPWPCCELVAAVNQLVAPLQQDRPAKAVAQALANLLEVGFGQHAESLPSGDARSGPTSMKERCPSGVSTRSQQSTCCTPPLVDGGSDLRSPTSATAERNSRTQKPTSQTSTLSRLVAPFRRSSSSRRASSGCRFRARMIRARTCARYPRFAREPQATPSNSPSKRSGSPCELLLGAFMPTNDQRRTSPHRHAAARFILR